MIKDERDISIERRTVKAQLYAVNGSLLLWMIILTETFRDKGVIPLGWPYLIFLSTILITLLYGAVGTLIGYTRLTGADSGE